MASTSAADAETNDSLIAKPLDSDNPNETAGINIPTAQNRKISFLEKAETTGPQTAQDGTNGQTPDTHDAEITRKQSIPPPSKPPKSVLKQRAGLIPPPPGVAPSSARPRRATFSPTIPPSPLSSPELLYRNPPLPGFGYYAQRPSVGSPLTTSSGPSPYFSPPVSWLPNHMRRGQKSAPNSKSPSMLQECFSAENSPYYTAPSLTPGFGAADLPKSGGGFEQETGESGAGPDDLLFASGRSRLKAAPMATRWNARGEQEVEFPSIVVWHLTQSSSPQDAENVLSDLLHATKMGDIGQEWMTTVGPGENLFRKLFRLADQITPGESVLDPKSPCAEIIDLLLEHNHIDNLLAHLCCPDGSGATSIRYLICKARSMGNPPGEPGDGGFVVPWVADTATRHAYEIASMSGADSLNMIPAIRLVESILPSVRTLDQLQRPIYRSFLEAVIRLIKRKELTRRGERPEVDPARRTAALHLISSTLRTYKSLLGRLEAESDMPAMPEKEWILEELGIANIVPYLEDENSHPLVRCMALRVLRDFADVDVEEVPRWEKLEDILVIAVDVLLWRTKWQHDHEETSKSLDIAKFCPHEDAYRVITSSPTDLVIPILSKALKADDKSALLEPLLSLIVDHSKLKDKYWPFMLSMLLHCGCLSLFHDILLPPVPPEKDFLYRTTCRAKTDACIGLTRCFEQMRAKDVKTIPFNVGVTLAKLANDEQLPLNLRGRAGDAFGALNENITTSLEMPLEAPRPLNDQLDSTPRSPNPDSVSPVRSPIHPTGLVTEATAAPHPRSESPIRMPLPELPNQVRPRPGVVVQHKGILKKWGAVFPEPREEASPYPQVTSRRGGGYDGYEPPLPRMYASDRTLRPSSQPLSIRPMTASDSDPESWSVKEQPDVQPPALQPRAPSSESPRTAISTFDENFKTPRTTFKSIVSDESGVENPNPPDQQFHSNSLRGATSAPPNGNKRGSGEDDLSAPPTPSVQSISGTDDEPVSFIPPPPHLPPSQLRALPRGKRGKKR